METGRNFSRKTKREAYTRADGRCETCGGALGHGGINYDHRINWALSRNSSLENCRVLCAACHLKKTAGYDIPVIAKVTRIADKRIGIKRASKKLPAGRASGISKKLNGEVVRRPERYESHHAAMANRQIGECDHIPMKAALDDSIGCIRCGQWLKGQ
jgi:5-methylcytosine-specific restriction enzyme A